MKITISLLITAFLLLSVDTGLLGSGSASAASTVKCSQELTLFQLWRRRLLWTGATLAALGGGYLGVEYAYTDPNYQATAQFEPSQMGNDVLGVSVFGDSLARGEGYLPLPQHLWSVRTSRRGWPFDLDSSESSGTSLFERIIERNPALEVKVTNYAWPGAYVDPAVNQSGAFKKYGFGVRDFRAQIAEAVASPGPMSNLNIMFIGHCNVDWKYDCDNYGLDEAKYKEELPIQTAEAYEKAMEPLIEKAKKQNYPVTFLVYGLINFRSVFIARNEAMEYKKTHPEAYPSSDISALFPSLLKDYQEETILVGEKFNAELRSRVEKLSRKHAGSNARFIYSNKLADGKFEQVKYLSDMDGLHPSYKEGNSHISDIVYLDIFDQGIIHDLVTKDEELRAPRR